MADIETTPGKTETAIKTDATSLLDKAKAAYTSGWQFWAPAVVLAALVGHLL
ncbi:hypothetical protein [Novosphingobium sp. Fuku2-ISO-50]|uniref:hypothetical protein n=1 Tax=Novosphingobium sp. Fuku2-ISO-50 TaxID=1739114 RepID=UPI000ACAAB4F|nr:hypothetical protein [Novosphingobium sp. Fuku2-ISO-50]